MHLMSRAPHRTHRFLPRATTLGLGAALLGAAAVAGAQPSPFEGVISMRLSQRTPQGTMGQPAEYLVRGGKVRMNMGTGMGGMALIADPQERKLFVLTEARASYMEMPLASTDAATTLPADVKVTRTGKRETVAGLSCEQVSVESGGERTDICLTKELGPYVNPLASLGRQGGGDWQSALAAEGFPLRVTLPDGSVALEVTRVERRRLANSLFSVPESYTKMAMPTRRPPG
jgi:hypothetical protein